MQASEIIARDFTTGRPAPRAKAEQVVVSSSKCPWHNLFKVERYIRPSFELSQVTFLETSVSFLTEQTEPHSLAEWRLAGHSQQTGTRWWCLHSRQRHAHFVSLYWSNRSHGRLL
jgi:hypothetical protein